MQMTTPGWGWLVMDSNDRLHVMTTEHSGNPIIIGTEYMPVVAIDLWEHSYFPIWRDDKESYIKEFYHIINWENVNESLSYGINNALYKSPEKADEDSVGDRTEEPGEEEDLIEEEENDQEKSFDNEDSRK